MEMMVNNKRKKNIRRLLRPLKSMAGHVDLPLQAIFLLASD
jgi:hypothetical protein